MTQIDVLIVEPEAVVARELERRLSSAGYGVTAVVAGADEALVAMESTIPDLVLMDMAIKRDPDGVTTAEKIRQRYGVPVVFVTVCSGHATLESTEAMEPLRYVIEPLEEDELTAAIETALRRHRMETEVNNRERWLSTVLDSIGEAVVAIDAQGRVTLMNPAAETLTGWSDEEAHGKAVSEVISIAHDEALESGETPVTSILEDKTASRPDALARLVARTGALTPVTVRSATIPDDQGNTAGTVFTFRDISQQIRAETERDEQRQLLRSVIDTLPDFILFKDRDSILRLCNESYSKYLGREMDDLIGTSDFDRFPPEKARTFREEDLQVLETGEAKVFTHPLEGPRWEESIKAPVRNEKQEIAGVLVAARDITDRVRAETERDEQRRMLRSLLDTVPDAILAKDRELRYVLCNKAFCDYYDLSEAEIIGKTDFELLSRPEDAEGFKAKDLRVLETGQTVTEKHLTETPRGAVWSESIEAPLRNEQGETVGLIAVARDITDRLEVEAERDAQRRMLKALLDSTPDIVIFKDRQSVYQACSDRYHQLLGPDIPMDQFLGRTDFDVFPEDAQRFRAEELRVMESGEPLTAEHLLQTSEGPRWFEAVKMPLLDEQGQTIGVFTTERDITDRRQAEAELDEQRRMLRAVLDTLPDFIIFKDRDSVIRVCNQGFCEFLGLPEEHVVGKTDLDLFPPEDARRYREEELEVMEAERTVVNIHRLEGPDGVRWDEAIKTPLRDDQGEVIGVLTAGRDITQRVLHEQEIEQRNRELTVLYEALRSGSASLDAQEVFRRVVHTLVEVGGYTYVSAYMQQGGELKLVEAHDYEEVLSSIDSSTGVLGRLLRTGQPQFVPDALSDPDFIAMSDGLIGEVGVPVTLENEVVGALNIETKDVASPLTEADLNLMLALADQLSLVMYNARLYSRLDTERMRIQQINEQLLALQEISTAVTSHLDLTQLLDSMAESATRLLRADSAGILLFDEDDSLTIHGSHGLSPEMVRGTRHDLGQSITGIVAQTGQPAIVPDVPSDARFDNAYAEEEHFLSMISTPLLSGDEVIGTLNVHSSTSRGAFDATHLRILSLLANQATVAIENARLFTATAESEVRYRSVFEGALDGIIVVDAESGYFLEANTAFQRMLGYSMDELRKRTVWEARAPQHREAAYRYWLRFLHEVVARGRLIPYQSKDGELIEAEVVAQIIELGGRRVEVSIIRDVTDKLQLEEQLRQSQKMEAIGTLAGGVAHDFNNLLGSVLGYASFLKGNLAPDDPARADVEVIERAARRGADLTRQLLAVARGGRYEIRPVSLNAQVREVVQLLSRTVDKSIAINPILDQDMAPIEGDAGQISQLLLNLCLNACEAMPGGGFLTIETKALYLDEETARRELGRQEAGNYALLTVRDTGLGMEPDVLEHVFEPFFSTKKGLIGKKHSGLGLATAFGIVKGHNGTIQVESEVGHGTTFKVWLPANVNMVAEQEVSYQPDVSRGSETVLIVDDDEDLCRMLDRVLSSAGYQVLTASGGPKALELFARNPAEIDLVILDMIMPQMSGAAVLQRLKEIDPHVFVLCASGYSDQARLHDIVTSGAQGFIQKPFSYQDILSEVRTLLDERGDR